MSWFTKTLSSSVGRKVVMSLTGLFLIVFLLEHMIGNLLLLKTDGGASFNEFAHFMKHSMIIQAGELVLFGGILFHAIDGIILVRKNKSARPVAYASGNKSRLDSWASKYMGPFGLIILIFIIIHLVDFFSYKYFVASPVADVTIDEVVMTDMAKIVYMKFQSIGYVIFYVIAMLITAFHLNHGFQSAFQTLGVNHVKYSGLIKKLSFLYSVAIPLGLALIPILIYFGSYLN